MMKNKLIKITVSVIGVLLILFGCIIAYTYYNYTSKFNTEGKPYQNYIGYIDQENSLLNDSYSLCNEGRLYHTYSSAGYKAYAGSKKQFKNQLSSEYKNKNYTDSGYLNFRFLVNCEGNAGWFEIIEMNLDLEESSLNKDMVDQLFKFTSNSKHWNSINYNDKAQNYYMYISYRIEHGEITEILP